LDVNCYLVIIDIIASIICYCIKGRKS